MSDGAEASGSGFWGAASDDVALERYRTLINATGDGIFQLDADGRFVAVNEAIVETTGYATDELVGEHVSALLADDDVASLERAIARQLLGEDALDEPFECPVRTADGDRIRCELRLNLLADDGRFEGTVGIVRDVTDRRRTERSLGDRERELRRERDLTDRLLEISPVGTMVVDDDGDVLRINERGRELLGIDGEDEPFSPTDRRTYDEAGRLVGIDEHPFARVLETGDPVYDRVLQVEHPDGDPLWLSVSAVPLLTDDGEVDRVVTTGEDVTHLKERERRLSHRTDELSAELDEILGRVSDAFYALDEAFRFTHVNERAAELMGRSADELLGAVVWNVFPGAVDSELYDRFHEAMETQEPVSFERDSDPFGIWAEIDVYPSETGLSVYFRDVTDRVRRERELEQSERRYRTLVEHFPNGIVTLFDHDLRYTLAAGKGFEDIPVEADELEGRSFREVWSEETADALEPLFQAALDGAEHSVELAYAGREWVVRAVPITDERGEVFAGMTMAQDITEQKERERYLADAKSQLEAATAAGAIGTWEWRIRDDRFVAGESFARQFGVDPEIARDGVSLEQFLSSIHPDDRDRVEERIDAAVEACSSYEAEYRVRNADGEYRWVVARGHVECDDDGAPRTFPGALADITERKRAEIALQKHKRQLETLFEVLPVGVVVAGPDGELLEYNDAAREIWGGDVFDAERVEEYDRYRGWWADTGEPVAADEWPMATVLDGEAITEPDVVEIQAADGERRIVMFHGMPVFDDGEVSRAVVTQTDITARREYQRKLEAAVEQLEASNERLEQFAHAASHDLQEPLRMISSYLQLIERRYGDALDEDGEEFLAYAVDGADRMREMIDGLLAYSRVETRGEPLEPVDLDDVVADVLDDLTVGIAETGAEITVDELPRVVGDSGQLRQVFQNLLHNAITYSGDEPPDVAVTAERTGDRWTVSVSDDGIGIDPAETERIFEVFHRLHGREERPGSGIGLALCQRIVERHGGRIWVDSEPGEGATFSLTLPAADE